MKLSDFTAKQWRVLLILMLVNFVNYVDRQIVFALFPSIRRDFGLSFVQLSYLATAFTVVLSLASFPLGMLADRISRRAVISAGILFWSGATFFTGLANSFRSLLIARGMVGVGEAAYTPAGAAVITASFSKGVRARVQGAFDIGMFIGGATGISLGGYIAAKFGWRYAFFLVGIPGFILGLAALRLPRNRCGCVNCCGCRRSWRCSSVDSSVVLPDIPMLSGDRNSCRTTKGSAQRKRARPLG